jgi:hypothetical protein
MIGLQEKIRKVYNEDDKLALKATPNEHRPFTLEGYLKKTSKNNQNNNSFQPPSMNFLAPILINNPLFLILTLQSSSQQPCPHGCNKERLIRR